MHCGEAWEAEFLPQGNDKFSATLGCVGRTDDTQAGSLEKDIDQSC